VRRIEASWKNLRTAFGSPAVEVAIDVMNRLASGIDKFSAVMVRNEWVAKALIGAAAGLGAGLVVLGTVAVSVAAIAAIGGGGVAAAILGTTAVLGALAAFLVQSDWRDLKSAFTQLSEWLRVLPSRASAAISAGFSSAISYLGSVYQRASADIRGAFSRLAEAVTTTVTGWGASFMTAVANFQSAAASVIKAIVDWLVGIPGRVLGGLTLSPQTREGIPAPGNPMGDEGATGGASPSAFVPSAPSRDVTVRIPVIMDGRQITEVVTRLQGKALNAVESGPSFYDRRRGGLSAGVVLA
jgi:hypothetical protein